MNLGAEIVRQCVDARNAHAVQTARNLVRAFVEFAAGMKHSQHHLEGGFLLFFVEIHGNAASVVDYLDGIIFEDCHVDVLGKAR